MDKKSLLNELHEKVNGWFNEKPQRPIADFLLDTLLEYLDIEDEENARDKAVD